MLGIAVTHHGLKSPSEFKQYSMYAKYCGTIVPNPRRMPAITVTHRFRRWTWKLEV